MSREKAFEILAQEQKVILFALQNRIEKLRKERIYNFHGVPGTYNYELSIQLDEKIDLANEVYNFLTSREKLVSVVRAALGDRLEILHEERRRVMYAVPGSYEHKLLCQFDEEIDKAKKVRNLFD